MQDHCPLLIPFINNTSSGIKDLFRCKAVWSRAKPAKNSNFLVVSYENKFVEDLGLNKLLKTLSIMNLCPLSRSAVMPTVSYKYHKTIRSSIVNYRNAVIVITCNYSVNATGTKQYFCASPILVLRILHQDSNLKSKQTRLC